MPDYLVESYHVRGAETPSPPRQGRVRHLRSILLPDDEVCLHVFAAPSAEAVRATLDAAAFTYERIVEAVTSDQGGMR